MTKDYMPRHRAMPAAIPSRMPVASAVYDGAELRPFAARPGATHALGMPSRMGQELRYRDGRIDRLPTENDLAVRALELSQGAA